MRYSLISVFRPFVRLAREQEAGIEGHRGPPKLDAALRVEREANRARCRVTHRVVPPATMAGYVQPSKRKCGSTTRAASSSTEPTATGTTSTSKLKIVDAFLHPLIRSAGKDPL